MSKIFNDPFRLEEYRAELASINNFKVLRETYNKNFPEIKNYNTGKLWDEKNDRGIIDKNDNPMAFDRYNSFADLIPNSNINVLNIGVGAGDLEALVLNKKKKLKWYGIDIAEESIRNMSRNFPRGSYIKGNILDFTYKKNFFDICLASEVLEHIPPHKIFKVYENVLHILKKGGKFIVSVPLNEGLEKMVKEGYNPNAHVRTYTEKLIKAELKIAGFNVIKEKKLYAFGKNYFLKSLIARFSFGLKHANNVIITAVKK